MTRAGRLTCLAFPLAAALAYAAAAAPPGHRAQGYVALHLVLAALMLAAWRLQPRLADVVLAGAAARLVLFFVPPFTTHDVARYLWDGKVALEGLDPYRLTADSAATAALRPLWQVAPEQAAYATPYPPGAIAIFAACAALGATLAPHAWKLTATAASIGTVWVAARLLAHRGLERHLPLVALSPLLVLETGVGAHLDALTTLAVAVALWAEGRHRPAAAGLALGLGGAVKLLPLVLLLPLARRHGWRFAAPLAATAALAIALAYLAAFVAGLEPLGSLPLFFDKWRFGSPTFEALSAWAGHEEALPLAAALGAAVVLNVALLLPTRPAASLAGALVFSPVVFPWYLAALVPATALAPSAALIAWTLAAPLSYEVIDLFDRTGRWAPATWPTVVTAGCLVAGLCFDALRAAATKASQKRASPQSPSPAVPQSPSPAAT